MANKVTISKKIGKDVVVIVEVKSSINATQAAKEAALAIESIKAK